MKVEVQHRGPARLHVRRMKLAEQAFAVRNVTPQAPAQNPADKPGLASFTAAMLRTGIGAGNLARDARPRALQIGARRLGLLLFS